MKTFRLLTIALSMLATMLVAGSVGAQERAYKPDWPEASPPLVLAKTGQTTSYYPGDDGDLQAGVVWPDPRFVDQGDGTLKDMLTGLIWLKDANCFGAMSWAEALSAVADLNQNPGQYSCQQYTGTYGDWRLPNINELRSLVNAGQPDLSTWLGTQGFVHVIPTDPMGRLFILYWSSTKGVYWEAGSWAFQAGNGSSWTGTKPIRWHVWPVRGESANGVARTGQTISEVAGDDGALQKGVVWPSPRFTVSDDTVIDNLTGLMWLKDANCMATHYPSLGSSWLPGGVSWQGALDFVRGINDGTYPDCRAGWTDWRLPNQNELTSLNDVSQKSPALPSGHPFVHFPGYHWTSTTVRETNYALRVAFWADGDVGEVPKDREEGRVWPVRSHQVIPVNNGPYLQNVTQNSITISWETGAQASYVIRYKLPQDETWTEVTGQTEKSIVMGKYLYEVTLTGLTHGTTYNYEVSVTGALKVADSFKTAPLATTTGSFKVAVYGDSQGRDAVDIPNREAPKHPAIVDAINLQNPDIMLHSGDLVDTGQCYSEWKPQFFNAATPLLQSVPMFPISGNHEFKHDCYPVEASEPWWHNEFFSVPELPQSVTLATWQNRQDFYEFTYGCAHIIGLNTYDNNIVASADLEKYSRSFGMSQTQINWLTDALSTPPDGTQWTVVFMHHPLFGSTLASNRRWVCDPAQAATYSDKKCSLTNDDLTTRNALRTTLKGLFETYGVDAVVSSHTHLYEHIKTGGIHYLTTPGAGVDPGTCGTAKTDITKEIATSKPAIDLWTCKTYADEANLPLYGTLDFTCGTNKTLVWKAWKSDGTYLQQGIPTAAADGLPSPAELADDSVASLGTVLDDFTLSAQASLQQQIPAREYDALMALFGGTGGAGWTHNTGWGQTLEPCSWYGITCGLATQAASPAAQQVVAIDLSQNNLNGQIPNLADLTGLQTLDLSGNFLAHRAPSSLCTLPAMQELDLGHNLLNEADDEACITDLDPDWTSTQVAPPEDVQAATMTATKVQLSWAPATNAMSGGYYQVYVAADPEGPYSLDGATGSLAVSGYEVDELTPGTAYYFMVNSFVPAYDGQPEAKTSVFSEPAATVTARRGYSRTRFQDGVAPTRLYQGTSDTTISQHQPDANFGAEITVNADGDAPNGSGHANWALLRWDLSSIPRGARIQSAKLTVHVTNTSGGQVYRLYPVPQAWDEVSVTWNNLMPWVHSPVLAEFAPSALGSYELDLNNAGREVIESWVNENAPNRGFIIANPNSADGFDFYAREVMTETMRPELSIMWSYEQPGDANGDNDVNAGDVSACILEYFDGDGTDPAMADKGTYAGTRGADANLDGKIDAGDVTCTVRTIFGQPCQQASAQASSAGAPALGMALASSGVDGAQVTVPIVLSGGDQDIASLAFSLDIDETRLSFDPADADGNGLPDALRFDLPPGFTPSVFYDPGDVDGELDIVIADLAGPLAALPDGVVAEVSLAVVPSTNAGNVSVGFSQDPDASFGNTTGQSVSGSTSNGTVLINPATIYLPLLSRP